MYGLYVQVALCETNGAVVGSLPQSKAHRRLYIEGDGTSAHSDVILYPR